MADEMSLPFHRKYRPTTISGYIGNEKLKESVMSTLRNGNKPQVMLFYGDSGCGKAQPLDSLVLTTSGYKKMGDIKVGDEVFTHKGNRGRVSGIYPQGVRPIYRITLSDRTYIDVSDEHLNCVYYIEDDKRTDLVVNTLELVGLHNKCNYNLCIDTPSVDWCNSIEDTTRFGINGIPKDLLFSNKDTRMRLLNNLFSYYGVVVDDKVELNFNAIHGKKLSDDVAFLLRSLGIVDILHEIPDLGYTHRLESNIRVSSNNVLIFDDSLSYIRYIESIEHIDDQECQCIMVDHPDHTYISDYFIPTHNTTIARLIAKEYLCTERDNDKGACGVCYNCQAVDDYIHTGDTSNLTSIKEIDIASDNGKRDLDAIVEDMMIPSFEWKIYILDECHEATSGAQNRLLKIVEEPPENVLIIFCTTNPEKMIPTLVNRCQIQLKVTKPTVKELAGLSKHICQVEDVEYDMKGLEFIANRAECTIRSNLQYLQRVINEQGKADYNSATKVFEEVSNATIIKFFKALKSHNVLSYVTLLHKIKTSMDLRVFLTELQQFVKRGIYVINGINLDGVSDGDLVSYRELFSDLGVEKISFLLNKLLSMNNNIEMELLVLGYSGIDTVLHHEEELDLGLETIQSLEGECSKEQSQAVKVIKEEEAIKTENGIKNADNLTQEASIDLIMQQMGGIFADE